MSEVVVEYPDFDTEDMYIRSASYSSETTMVVKPPIAVGELFEETIIGQNPLELSLKHIVSTDEATILEARIGGTRDRSEKVDVIKEIASRITVLAAHPSEATVMRHGNPFIQRWVSISVKQADLKSKLPA